MHSHASAETIALRAEHAQQIELADRIARLAPEDGMHPTAIPQLYLVRISSPQPCSPVLYEPRLGIIAQGSKLVMLSGDTYRCDPLHYLVVSMTLPVIGQVIEATPEKPYLSLRLDIDLDELSALMLDAEPPAHNIDRGMYVARADTSLLDASLRLMRLLENPRDLRVLAPASLREIFYRLLIGDLGHRLRDLATAGSRSNRIVRAVAHLRERYQQPLSIEELASELHMSTSSLHHQFKAATSMSPLQFQKQLRLHEARRLMMAGGMEAMSAARHVGYESPSQFSREYKRLFGAPPRSEVGRSRAAPVM